MRGSDGPAVVEMQNLRVGLTGGIGSGKSTVSRLLAERGAFVVDADAIAREVVAAGTDGLAALVDEFGPEILLADGSLDRSAVAGVVFADPSQRARLDAITHPRIAALTHQRFVQAEPDQIIVHDVPLLTELSLQGNYAHVVVVDCPDEIRIERLVERGHTADDARARITAQASRQQRLGIADTVLDNSGSIEDLVTQVDVLWDALKQEAGSA